MDFKNIARKLAWSYAARRVRGGVRGITGGGRRRSRKGVLSSAGRSTGLLGFQRLAITGIITAATLWGASNFLFKTGTNTETPASVDPSSTETRTATTQSQPVSFAVDSSRQTTVQSQQGSSPSILIGSFNIQKFGRSKMGKSTVTEILVDCARRFDLLAIQELQSTEQNIMDLFLEQVNADGSQFRYIVGPRQGLPHNNYREQYVYLYDSSKIEVIEMPYVVDYEGEVFHRPPLATRFRCRHVPREQAFSFILMNIHTDPDLIRYELRIMGEMVEQVRRRHPDEDDIIVLGDLNAPPSFYVPFNWFSNKLAVIPDEMTTNTRRTRNYDNLVFDRLATSEFTGRAGVFDFQKAFDLTLEEALQVSDHFPVWAQFSAFENSQIGIADGRPAPAAR